ncbi:MAG: hypothetical protein PWQ35_61 [Patescibacteria group bacterium]|nr:hypothetical protein [Patescibacteria group bacterium]
MANDKYNKDEDLRDFKDLSGVSVRQMNIGLWIAENRPLLTRALTIFLIIISAFFFIYSTYGYIIYFMSDPIDNLPENQVMSPRNVVKPMQPGALEIFKVGNSYDLVVTLVNENDNFWAEFDYCFYQGEKKIDCQRDFILPGENYLLTTLGVKLENTADINFKIEDIFWSRINRRQIDDWTTYYKERINFEFLNINFFNSLKSGLSENLKLNRLEFDILNNSPYSYYQVDFDILFYANERLIGVQKYLGKNIKAGEKRAVTLSWAGDLNGVNQVKIVPRVNIILDSVYLKFQDTF